MMIRPEIANELGILLAQLEAGDELQAAAQVRIIIEQVALTMDVASDSRLRRNRRLAKELDSLLTHVRNIGWLISDGQLESAAPTCRTLLAAWKVRLW
jgi:hypothetical protein